MMERYIVQGDIFEYSVFSSSSLGLAERERTKLNALYQDVMSFHIFDNIRKERL